jgi:hypothetical protein
MRRGVPLAIGLLALGPILAPAAAAAGEPQGRVLLLVVPGLSWDELYAGDTPALDSVVDDAAVAALSVRNVLPETSAGDGYAAMSAGSRARGVFAEGQVLEPDEDFFGAPAGAVYARNTGVSAEDGMVAFGFPALDARNERLDYGAEVGALGQALADGGVPRAVIANADGDGLLEDRSYHRGAAIALIDRDGTVPAGAVSGDLLEPAPSFPFGVRLSQPAVGEAFASSWEAGGVVMVELSDLARADRYAPVAAADHRPELRRAALRASDEIIGDLIRQVDATRDAVVVVSPYHRAGKVHLTVAAVRAPHLEPGLLRSGSTRRTGVVTLVDIAPTILDLAGVERPGSMEGRRFERAADGPSSGAERAEHLATLDEAARYRDRMVAPVAVTFVVLQAVLWIGAVVALRRDDARGRRVVGLAALAMLAYLPATYLAGLVEFHGAPSAAYWCFIVLVAGATAAAALALGRQRQLDPLLLCLAVVFGLLTVDMLLGAPLQLNTVFGYSPTVGGRFAGMGNLAYGQFAGAAFLLCGLLSQRLAGLSMGTAIAFAVLVVAVLIDGMPIWGSDVGGVLAFVPAIGVTAARLLGQRVRWRIVAMWGTAAVVVVGVFALLDLSRPADRRTHLARLVEAVADQGIGAFESVVTRKIGANLSVIVSSVWTAMVPIALGFIAYLLWRAPGLVRSIRETIRESLPGLAVVGFLGFAFNDSGIAVPGVMLGVINASLVYLTVRTLPAEVAT